MAIRLEKGQRINLEKDNGIKLQNICVGVNWGAIKKKNWQPFSKSAVSHWSYSSPWKENRKAYWGSPLKANMRSLLKNIY